MEISHVTFSNLPLMITSYINIVQFSNQDNDIDIGAILFTKLHILFWLSQVFASTLFFVIVGV